MSKQLGRYEYWSQRTPSRACLLLLNWKGVDYETSARPLYCKGLVKEINQRLQVPTSIDCKVQSIDTEHSEEDRSRISLSNEPLAFSRQAPTLALHTEVDLPMTLCMISRDHPSVIRHAATTIEPPTMNGLLLPHGDLDLSANAPISGAIMMPDNGLF